MVVKMCYIYIFAVTRNGTPVLTGTKIFHSNDQTETGTKTVFTTLLETEKPMKSFPESLP